MSIIDDLNNLTEEELEAVGRLISKFSKRHGQEEEEEPVVNTKPKKASDSARGRTEPRNKRSNRGRDGDVHSDTRGRRPNKGSPGRIEAVNINNKKNEFVKMPEFNSAKGDVEIDKKLWGKRRPTPRNAKYEPVEVQCKKCELYFDVNPALVLIDEESGLPNFICNDCAGAR